MVTGCLRMIKMDILALVTKNVFLVNDEKDGILSIYIFFDGFDRNLLEKRSRSTSIETEKCTFKGLNQKLDHSLKN